MSRYKEPYTLYKRGNYWYYRTYNLNGVRTAGTSTGKKLKSEARAFCEELNKTGRLITTSKKFETFAKDFFEPNSFYFADRIKPPAKNTVLIYKNNLSKYILPFFKDYDLNDINYILLKKFRTTLIDRCIAYNSIQSILGTLKIILTSAYRSGIIINNPMDKLEPLKAYNNDLKDAFTIEEVKLIYNSIDPVYKDVILAMALTGLRISEATGVTAEDFKLCSYGEYIYLTKQFNRGEVIPLKTKNAIRPIPVIPEVKTMFNTMLKTNSDKVLFYNAFKVVRPHIKDFEKRNITAHSLRHFFITNCKSSGIIESKVEFVAGHSLTGVSAIYTNYTVEDLEEFTKWQKETLNKILN